MLAAMLYAARDAWFEERLARKSFLPELFWSRPTGFQMVFSKQAQSGSPSIMKEASTSLVSRTVGVVSGCYYEYPFRPIGL